MSCPFLADNPAAKIHEYEPLSRSYLRRAVLVAEAEQSADGSWLYYDYQRRPFRNDELVSYIQLVTRPRSAPDSGAARYSAAWASYLPLGLTNVPRPPIVTASPSSRRVATAILTAVLSGAPPDAA